MSASTYRDRQTTEQHHDAQDLMCAAHGCPNIWTTQSTKLCRWHSAASPVHWPIVTEELVVAANDRMNAKRNPPAVTPLSRADKTAILERIRRLAVRMRTA